MASLPLITPSDCVVVIERDRNVLAYQIAEVYMPGGAKPTRPSSGCRSRSIIMILDYSACASNP